MKDEKTTIEGQLRVKELLKERGMMMKDLAERLDIARESLTRALQGNPTYSTLKAIADEIGVSVTDLFIKEGEPPVECSPVHGYIKIKGEIMEITSKEDLIKVLEMLDKNI